MTTEYLTATQVALREGLSRQGVARLCRVGGIFPVMKDDRDHWLIHVTYAITITAGCGGRPAKYPPPPPKHPRRGRPLGVKNSRPYPRGVKRPRRKVPSSA